MDFWVAYFQTNPIGFMIWKNTGEFVATEVGPTLEVLYIYICMKKSSFGLGVQAIIYGDIIGLEWGYNGALYMF